MTGIDGKNVRMFDPYYCDQEYEQKDIIRVLDQPTCCNRIVPWKYFNKTALNMYSLDRTMGGKLSFYLMKRQDLRKKRPSNTLFRGESRK